MLQQDFEFISKSVWNGIKSSNKNGISLGETTISDMVLLFLAQQNRANIQIFKTPQHLESIQGTDWEWWIGNKNQGWIRLAIQAKKVKKTSNKNTDSYKYESLTHKVTSKKTPQVDILENYAKNNNAIPLYALYNYVDLKEYHSYWNCSKPLNKEQLGVTLTTIDNIKYAINNRGEKTFQTLHELGQFPNPNLGSNTIPLCCLLTSVQNLLKNGTDNILTTKSFTKYIEAPEFIYQDDIFINGGLKRDNLSKFYQTDDTNKLILPKRIIKFTTE